MFQISHRSGDILLPLCACADPCIYAVQRVPASVDTVGKEGLEILCLSWDVPAALFVEYVLCMS